MLLSQELFEFGVLLPLGWCFVDDGLVFSTTAAGIVFFFPNGHCLLQYVYRITSGFYGSSSMWTDTHDGHRCFTYWHFADSVVYCKAFDFLIIGHQIDSNLFHLLKGHWFVAFVGEQSHLLAVKVVTGYTLENANCSA